MNWLEKIYFLIKEDKEVGFKGHYLIDIRYRDKNWSSEEIQTLKNEYPQLPKEYIDFIQEFDSIGIAWVIFYGSKTNNIIPLLKEIDYWREEGLPEEYFPFGKGPGGEVYCFNKKNEVIDFACDDYDFENPIIIASSLEDFVDQCLLGPRYVDFNHIDDDTFYQFMKEQGWVQVHL